MTITLDEIFFSVLNKFYEVCLLARVSAKLNGSVSEKN